MPGSSQERRARTVEVMRRGNPWILLLAAAALGLATAARLPAAWESGNALNHVSGAWMALADDLAHGRFYRPMVDPELGYGGTRWFPLAFAAHAGLRRAGLDLIVAGYALSLATGLLSVAAAYVLLRRVGTPRAPAAAFAALTLGTFATQYSLSSSRYDLLPVGLGALGLAAVARGPSGRALAAAAVLFALGFAAKPTALTAPAAAMAWLLLRRERRAAVILGAGVAAGMVAVVGLTNAFSAGRFFELLEATAVGGGSARDLLVAPVRLAHEIAVEDPAAIGLLGASLAAALAGLRGHVRSSRRGTPRAALLPVLWLGAALAAVVVVYASPGTGVNHLVEVEVAAALSLGTAWRARGTAGSIARGLAPVACALGLVVVAGMAREDLGRSRLGELRALAAALPPGTVLSEDPLLPLVAGQRPFVLDTWMLRLASERDPDLARPLLDELRRDEFAAVVLFQDLDLPGSRRWYDRGNLGLDVVGEVARHYRLAETYGRYHLYLPARAAPTDAPVAVAPPARTRRSQGPVPPRSTGIPASSAALGARATP
ncbi:MULTISPECIES: glycosyltransferase 87 family protein [Anaeromyxobacter]|uniref:glycosyltransferase 87 family protein n=1 Tax=Anaeromyxobacter TaxID=161492 RepID=UPI001F5862BD|nr:MULTISPECIES: glycosyltransferase 87 family protein [unclassified Anaeromyxobacter]